MNRLFEPSEITTNVMYNVVVVHSRSVLTFCGNVLCYPLNPRLQLQPFPPPLYISLFFLGLRTFISSFHIQNTDDSTNADFVLYLTFNIRSVLGWVTCWTAGV